MSTKRIDTPPEIDEMLASLIATNAELEKRVKFYEERDPGLKQAYAEHQAKNGQPDGAPLPEDP
jgi:hypothetical protein